MMMPEMRQGVYRNSDHDECVSAFDAAGPSFVPAAGDTTTWIYDEATGLLTSKLYPDGNGPAYTYTIDGKPATRTWARGVVTEYTYDVWGNVRRVDYSDTTPSIVIDYDSMGRETNITDAAGTTAVLYDPCGAVSNETVTGALGTKSISRFYDTFGRKTVYSSGAQSLANPYRFSSEYADDTLGLVYYNYRHYNPLIGRWTGRDPIEEAFSLNLFGYCLNASIFTSDNLGLSGENCKCEFVIFAGHNNEAAQWIDEINDKYIKKHPDKIFWFGAICCYNLAMYERLRASFPDNTIPRMPQHYGMLNKFENVDNSDYTASAFRESFESALISANDMCLKIPSCKSIVIRFDCSPEMIDVDNRLFIKESSDLWKMHHKDSKVFKWCDKRHEVSCKDARRKGNKRQSGVK